MNLNQWVKDIKELFFSYLTTIVYPFRIHDYLSYNIMLPEAPQHQPKKLTLYQAIGLSWFFEVLRGFLRIFLIYLTFTGLFAFYGQDWPFLREISEGPSLSWHYFVIFFTIVQVILFPVYKIFITEFWILLLTWVGGLLEITEDMNQKILNTLTAAESAHVLSIVPIFGDLMQGLYRFFLLFAGLRKNLQASSLLCVIILLIPSFILVMIASTLFLLFFMLF
ncbi:MAG: hypothetical protein JNM93_02325 [Bacteriovoracaceae bacterium]|nr:hypothetical protein [Bacteriovoracaceae bacterium]